MRAQRTIGMMFLALAQVVFVANAVFASPSDGAHVIALGIGPELNMNCPDNVAGAVALGFDYSLPFSAIPFAVGANVAASNNFSGIYTLEISALFRWYVRSSDGRHEGWFVQANMGASLFRADRDTPVWLLAELRGGYRWPVGARLFIEPYARLGHPVMLGIGVLGGMRIPPVRRAGGN